MKTKLIPLVLATVGGCMSQTNTNSGEKVERPQRSFVGDVPTTVADSVAETRFDVSAIRSASKTCAGDICASVASARILQQQCFRTASNGGQVL